MEISDDGRGIDAKIVRKKVIEAGIMSAEELDRMDDTQIINLIFIPGFSTASEVTSVSGRGVGMDVVKTNIEKIGGMVDLQSTVGKGTTLKVKIPLTLAIIPALLVTVGDGCFALPQISLLELVRLDEDEISSKIEYVSNSPVYRLRGNLLPLVYLRDELHLKPDTREQKDLNIVVLQAEKRTFGLVVDSVKDTAEIVVKPLGKQLKTLRVFAGATILGDGTVALIVDVLGLAQKADLLHETRDEESRDESESEQEKSRTRLLLFRLGKERRVAIPLSAIDRLEELPCSEIECSHGIEIVQYRGEILPLIRVAEMVGVPNPNSEQDEMMKILVYNRGGSRVGLIVSDIIDIIDQHDEIHVNSHVGDGFVGVTVVDSQVTDVLDVPRVLSRSGLAASPSWMVA